MDITPMIDCTFLLLIFFLLTFKSDEGAVIRLPPAKHGVPVPAKNAVLLTLNVAGSDQPAAIYKGNGGDSGQRVTAADLEALEEEIAAYVEAGIAKGKQFVLIRAAEDVKHRDVARVARAASRVAAVEQLHIAVLEEQ